MTITNKKVNVLEKHSYIPEIGDIWRKHGPCDWMKIECRQWPKFSEFDGGLKGASVQISTGRGGWYRDSVFVAAPIPDDFASYMKSCGRSLIRKNKHQPKNKLGN
ncbi:MAG: hypothetical protein ACOCWG_02575 [bacterium]